MFFTACNKCGVLFHVLGRPGDFSILHIPEWKQSYPCVISGCSGRAHRIYNPDWNRPRKRIQLHAYYRALHGFGLVIEGEPASACRVRELLLTKRIHAASLEPAGDPERAIINGLTLEDGTKLHFGASSKGACVYYIEEANSEIDLLSPEGDPGDGPEDRGEAGHPGSTPEGPERASCPDGVPGSSGPPEPAAGEVRAGGS